MPDSYRLTIVENSRYTVQLEYNKDYVIFHLPDIKEVSKSMILELRETTKSIFHFITTIGYPALWVAVEIENTSINGLARSLGFKFTSVSVDGVYNVYSYNGE